MQIAKIAGRFSVLLDSGVTFDIVLEPWSGRGRGMDVAELADCVANRVRHALAQMGIRSEAPSTPEREIPTVRPGPAMKEPEPPAEMEAARKPIANIPAGFRDESTTERPRRGRPPKGE